MSTASLHPITAAREMAGDIKLAHSVFALPFALLASFMAVPGSDAGWRGIDWSRFGGQLALIVLAMVLARTVAMLANRYLDRNIDARNPRTAGRAIPAGRLSPGQVLMAILLLGGAFVLTCGGFGVFFGNWWPLLLSLPVLFWISAYGWFKRFTKWCHLYLGSSLAISPLAAAIAIQPASLGAQPALWLLALMVLSWVAAFDIIYALQDIEIDRKEGLHSIPSRLGMERGLWISRALHTISAAALAAAWFMDERFSVLFGIGVVCVVALLIYEHATVSRWGTKKIALAFFTLNGVISCSLGVLGCLDIVLN
ncbi:MAG: 4-hydroxybenzoate octaprenyltransferase [Phycisphaerales bacterium]|nr:MAG: 4-hydroxybenzoate octaprenyltransferase [Phycisphaerales bacterium]